MHITRLAGEFLTVFTVALGTTAIVTLLWNLVGH
jgi:hypothetical protein